MSQPSDDPTGTASQARWRRWLPRALAEAGLIVLSVLLAFAVDEWRGTRERRARARQALTAIAAELDSNRALVRRSRLHHRAISDSVARYVAAGAPLPERIYYGGMFNPASVLDAAWQSAREGGAVERLPYPVVVRLSALYTWQQQYRHLYEGLMQSVYSDMMVRGIPAAFRDNSASWQILLSDFADREGTLEAMYDSTLSTVRRTTVR